MDGPAIRLEGLVKSYGDVRALDGIDLTVPHGEVFGFLGPNGAGKTTAIRILMDLIRPTAGRAEVLGFDAQRQSLEVRRRCGYLPGDLQLYHSLTGAECFDLMASLRRDGVATGYRDALVERLRLDPTRRIGALSKGNRQKVGLIIALMAQPELVVLDEPTSGLDPLMQEEVEAILREIVADGRSVFFSSHVLSEVEQVANRVAMLRDGRIVAVADLAEQRRLAPRRIAVTFARIHRTRDPIRLPGHANRCPSEAGMMVCEQPIDPEQGAPVRCDHRIASTGLKRPSTTTAWWPTRGCCCRPRSPSISVCSSSSTPTSTSGLPRVGRTSGTSC